jgi:hypothetical protein
LTAIQVKEIILNSVVKINHAVTIPGMGKVPFSELCKSGVIVNAFNALKLAATYYDIAQFCNKARSIEFFVTHPKGV